MKKPLIVILMFFIFPAYAETCRVSGCNGELCESIQTKSMTSICVVEAEYACYKTAKCEEQQNGQCGWTQTAELEKCIAEKKNSAPRTMELK